MVVTLRRRKTFAVVIFEAKEISWNDIQEKWIIGLLFGCCELVRKIIYVLRIWPAGEGMTLELRMLLKTGCERAIHWNF